MKKLVCMYVHKSDIFQGRSLQLIPNSDFKRFRSGFAILGSRSTSTFFDIFLKEVPQAPGIETAFTYHASRKCQSKNTTRKTGRHPPLSCRNDKLMLFGPGFRWNHTEPSPKKWHVTKLGFVVDCWEVCQRGSTVYLEDIKLSQPKRLVISLEGPDTLKFSQIKIHTNEKTCQPCLVGFWVSLWIGNSSQFNP